MPTGTMLARCNCGKSVGVCNCLCHEARHRDSFTLEEVMLGYAMRGGTKVYCCYGMYCEAGHSDDCLYIAGVASPGAADGEQR